MTDTNRKTLAQAEAEPWHEITLQRTRQGWHWSLKTYAGFDDTKGEQTDSSATYRSAAGAAAAAEAEIAEPGRALRLAREATQRARKNRAIYEIEGDDGVFRLLERQGRGFAATMAPGVTGYWDTLREARADHTVRRRTERRA